MLIQDTESTRKRKHGNLEQDERNLKIGSVSTEQTDGANAASCDLDASQTEDQETGAQAHSTSNSDLHEGSVEDAANAEMPSEASRVKGLWELMCSVAGAHTTRLLIAERLSTKRAESHVYQQQELTFELGLGVIAWSQEHVIKVVVRVARATSAQAANECTRLELELGSARLRYADAERLLKANQAEEEALFQELHESDSAYNQLAAQYHAEIRAVDEALHGASSPTRASSPADPSTAHTTNGNGSVLQSTSQAQLWALPLYGRPLVPRPAGTMMYPMQQLHQGHLRAIGMATVSPKPTGRGGKFVKKTCGICGKVKQGTHGVTGCPLVCNTCKLKNCACNGGPVLIPKKAAVSETSS